MVQFRLLKNLTFLLISVFLLNGLENLGISGIAFNNFLLYLRLWWRNFATNWWKFTANARVVLKRHLLGFLYLKILSFTLAITLEFFGFRSLGIFVFRSTFILLLNGSLIFYLLILYLQFLHLLSLSLSPLLLQLSFFILLFLLLPFLLITLLLLSIWIDKSLLSCNCKMRNRTENNQLINFILKQILLYRWWILEITQR